MTFGSRARLLSCSLLYLMHSERLVMAKSFGVFVTEPTELDLEVFRLWLSGEGVKDACEKRMRNEASVPDEFRSNFKEMIFSETQDQFRLFQILETYLQLPSKFLNQTLSQLPMPVKQAMIQQYYAFDEVVVREFLGKKLSTKNRKDLDDVSEKTAISLISCRRQFDNIKQVLQVVDDYEGSLVENIKAQFSLPEELARSYASVVFISHNRFETQKKKLSHLTFSDFIHCASEMIDHWTAGSEGSHAVDDDLELDRDFLHDLHDLKVNMLDRAWIDRHLKFVLKDLNKRKCTPIFSKAVQHNFPTLSKSIISLGASLIHSKDLKDFFVDIIDNILQPLQQLGWAQDEINTFFSSVGECFSECEQAHSKQTGRPGRKDKPWCNVYLRYLDTLKRCLLILYKS